MNLAVRRVLPAHYQTCSSEGKKNAVKHHLLAKVFAGQKTGKHCAEAHNVLVSRCCDFPHSHWEDTLRSLSSLSGTNATRYLSYTQEQIIKQSKAALGQGQAGLLVPEEVKALTVLYWASIKTKPAPFTVEELITPEVVPFWQTSRSLLYPKQSIHLI